MLVLPGEAPPKVSILTDEPAGSPGNVGRPGFEAGGDGSRETVSAVPGEARGDTPRAGGRFAATAEERRHDRDGRDGREP